MFGGKLRNLAAGRGQRPLSTTKSMHLVLVAKDGEGDKAFTTKRNRETIDRLVASVSERTGVKVFRKGTSSNQLHLIIKLPNRSSYASFVRGLAGTIGMQVGVTWACRPFTRILESERDMQSAGADFDVMEGAGLMEFSSGRARGVKLTRLN